VGKFSPLAFNDPNITFETCTTNTTEAHNQQFNLFPNPKFCTMSEYQQYHFKAIDRPLTHKEQEKISSWSSRANVNSTSAKFQYNYGDFPETEEKVVEKYFDALFYFSNLGTYRLMFRFPLEAIDSEKIAVFEREAETGFTTHLQLLKKKNCWLLDFYWSDDGEDDRWMEEDFSLGGLISIREQIMRDDYRALYLFWIKLATYAHLYDVEEYEDELEDEESQHPIVPPNLGKLNSTLRNFVDFFDIDEDLIKAAASFGKINQSQKIDYAKLIKQLPEKERMDFLVRLAKGETNLEVAFNRRLKYFLTKDDEGTNENRPSPLKLVQKSEGIL
jgi:hypothetical protein